MFSNVDLGEYIEKKGFRYWLSRISGRNIKYSHLNMCHKASYPVIIVKKRLVQHQAKHFNPTAVPQESTSKLCRAEYGQLL